MAKRIVMTGGGSAGHVTPNLALIPRLRAEGFEIHYIGTEDGIEKSLISPLEDVAYYSISAGKLRRYFSWKNFMDPFRVLAGIFQARRIIHRLKPDAVFSKGGYVGVPVVIGALGIAPAVVHESDYTPGLANRISARFADKVCVTFEDTLKYAGPKGVFTGTPIRPGLYGGDRARGLRFAGFSGSKPLLLAMGGSLGAQAVNEALRAALPRLAPDFDIIHLCGRGKLDESVSDPAYVQYEYISEELPDLMAAADIVLSRAGANAVFELLALAKPALLIPLPKCASRGDQILNAAYFARRGYAMTLPQEELTPDRLCASLAELYRAREAFTAAMKGGAGADGTERVLDVIRGAALSRKR